MSQSKPAGVARQVRLAKLDQDGEPTSETVSLTGPAIVSAEPHDGRYALAFSGHAGDDQLGPIPDHASISIEIPNPDPVLLYLATGGAAGHPPIPTAYRAEWWPAAVRVPGRPQPIPRAKVYATREGLYVYTEAPSTGDPNGTRPEFYSPINYEETPRPATGYAARQAGIKLNTGAGPVIVQPLSGCGCSNRTLDGWRPGWGSHIEPWEA